MKSVIPFFMAATLLAASDMTVGVLPFADATATGGASLGESLGRATQAEIVHSTRLEGRVIVLPTGTRSDRLDSEKILAIGRDNHVDLMIYGTVLDAKAEDSNHRGSGPSIFGQSIGLGLHSTTATVTLQADIYDVGSGKKLNSSRLTGTQSDKKVSGDVYTSLGSIDTSSQTFQKSTLGKAMQKAITDMVKQVADIAGKQPK